MKKRIVLLVGLLLVFVSCSSQKELIVSHANPNLTYEGRVKQSSNVGTELYWPGTSVNINFEGTDIYTEMHDEKGENFYTIIIDGKIIDILNPSSDKKKYLLASGLSDGKHSLTLFKRTEFSSGTTTFYNFSIQKNAKVLDKSPTKKRKIEFYGDSISAGYAMEDFSGKDSGVSQFTNNYLAYGALTARHFDAEYNCICKGGIGLMISWFPYNMTDIYNRLNPLDENSSWNFAKDTPDVVVVNLFQNDSWLVNKKDHPEFKKVFGTTPPSKEMIIESYKSFISLLRKQYPESEIICALGNMDATKKGSPWPSYILEAAIQLNDPKMHTLIFPYKESKGHPSVAEQQVMAESLINFIEKNIVW